MRTAGLVAALVLVAGCASMPEVTVPKTVSMPVPVACVSAADVPERPQTPTPEQLLAMGPYLRTIAVWNAYLELRIYAAQLAAIVDGCGRLPAPKLNAGK